MSGSYRIDQVGSLIRPPALLDARDAFAAGHISRDQLRRDEDAAILAALATQRQIGVSVFSDGEMRRDAWMTNFSQAVAGFEDHYPVREERRPDGTVASVTYHAKAVRARLHQHQRIAGVDAAFMREHSPGPFKITLPSPSSVTRMGFRPGLTDAVYANREELHRDAVAIVRGELQALVKDGATYLQLDEGFNSYVDPDWRRNLLSQGRNPEQVLEQDITADNACYDAISDSGVTRAMHLCRGSRVKWHFGAGDYNWLAERLFERLHVDRFLLEYDTEQAGGFEPLRFVPKGKIVVLGLVTVKQPQLEGQDDLLRRIEEAAHYCPIEQLALSTECGFQGAADRDGAHLTIDQQWRKLELVADTARKVWADADT
jgi:5-methyltetrahydropteroyltriglutamate--homocysteine methyltransferase